MDRDTDQQAAVDALKQFLAAMRKWELAVIADDPRMDSLETDEEYREAVLAHREKLATVFDQHCEVGRNTKRLKWPGLSSPAKKPDYDPDDEIVEVSTRGSTVQIQIKAAATVQLLKYEMKKVDGQWRVKDNRKVWRPVENKWVNYPL